MKGNFRKLLIICMLILSMTLDCTAAYAKSTVICGEKVATADSSWKPYFWYYVTTTWWFTGNYDKYTETLYKGNTHFSEVQAVTDAHPHKKGEQGDISITLTNSKSKTFEVGVNAEATIKTIFTIGGEMSYSYTATTETGVTVQIPKNKGTGKYYYGVRAKLMDLRYTKVKKAYYRSGRLAYTKNIYDKKAAAIDGPLQYNWYRV